MNLKKTLLVISSIISFSVTSCNPNSHSYNPNYRSSNSEIHEYNDEYFYIKSNTKLFNGVDDEESLMLKQFEPVSLSIHLPRDKWLDNEDNRSLISINHSGNLDFVYMGHDNSEHMIEYQMYLMSVNALNEKDILRINFDDRTYEFNLELYQYDNNYNINKADVTNLGDEYLAFIDMVGDISYHSFVPPFKANDPKGKYDYDGVTNSYSYTRFFNNEYENDYIDYLSDSVFYPSSMEMAFDNPNSTRYMRMMMASSPESINYMRTQMPIFEVVYSVIDTSSVYLVNPLVGLSFTAVAKNLVSTSESYNREMDLRLHDTRYLLRNIYPNDYYHYPLVVDNKEITIDITADYHDDMLEVYGYFDTDSYAYMLNCKILTRLV